MPCDTARIWGISGDFSPLFPVTGRLHTRYAPVRRSSAAYCYALLPLDLHVLGLPLAFILSQDQTLHCKNCSLFLPLTLQCTPSYLYRRVWHTLSLVSSVSMCSRLRPLFSTCPLFERKRVQKYNHFRNWQIFFEKNLIILNTCLAYQHFITEIFFQRTANNTPKNRKTASIIAKIAHKSITTTENMHF